MKIPEEVKSVFVDNRCKKDFVFNPKWGQIEYIVQDKACLQEYAVFNGKEQKKQPCNKEITPTDKGYIVSNYYCIKETNDGKPLVSSPIYIEKEPTSSATLPNDKTVALNTTPITLDERRTDTDIQALQSQCAHSFPDMKCIPAGSFLRGSNSHKPDEKPEEKVYISEFYMDTFEVTNENFQKCLDAGKCKECLKTKKCRSVSAAYGKIYQRPRQPVVGISWYSAKEYCEFMGKRLPTEAEWEKAARGPNGNIFPWGNEEATCKRAIIEEEGRKGCAAKKIDPPRLMPTQDVALYAPGVYGLYDMAGNSWEWVNDYYTPSYQKCGEACRGRDPKGPCNGEENCKGFSRRVVRGGSWWWPSSYARGSYRRHHDPKNYPEYHHFGFRCAKSL
jgi:formylglycine-generating enzyme